MRIARSLRFLAAITALFILSPLWAQESTAAEGWDEPALVNPDSWSIILLPDVQSYVKFDRNQPTLDLMMEWILSYKDDLNTQLVLCTGDMVEQNDMPNPMGPKVNQTGRQQWEAVSSSFRRLDGKLPYVVITGNHDYGFRNAENRNTRFPEYFTAERNQLNQELLREVGMSAHNRPTLENAVYEFRSPHGEDYLVLALEFAPRDSVLEWANQVVAQEKYKNHTIILLTHHFLSANNERSVWNNQYAFEDANYGDVIWERLVQPANNIRLTINGHIGRANDVRAHLGFRTDPNTAGKSVHQMAFNAQALGGGWYGNGGDGWLRILEFFPDGKTVLVRTYSPLFGISPTTREHAWRRESWDQFTMEIE